MIQDRQAQLYARILQWRTRLEAARERLGAIGHPERASAVDAALTSIAGFVDLGPAQLDGWFQSTRFLPERGRSLEDADAAWRELAAA